jgi:hypothetical protein
VQSSAINVLLVPVRCPLRISWCRSSRWMTPPEISSVLLRCLAFAASATLEPNKWNFHRLHDMTIWVGGSEAGIRLTSTLWVPSLPWWAEPKTGASSKRTRSHDPAAYV